VTKQEREALAAVLEAIAAAKGEEPVVLDLTGLTTMTDYFVLAHGTNTRQVQSMAKRVEENVRELCGLKPHHVEGLGPAQWVLMDYGFFIVHLFIEEKRGYYGLERIWMDAKHVKMS
jgi:ribosome-associated protein